MTTEASAGPQLTSTQDNGQTRLISMQVCLPDVMCSGFLSLPRTQSARPVQLRSPQMTSGAEGPGASEQVTLIPQTHRH